MAKPEKPINLKILFGDRFKVEFDRKTFYANKAVAEDSSEEDPEWHYSIPCKYGEISAYSDEKLLWYCTSIRVAKRVEREIGDSLGKMNMGTTEKPIYDSAVQTYDFEADIYFDPEMAEKIFEYAHPRKRIILSPEEKARRSEQAKNNLEKYGLLKPKKKID